MEAIGRIRRYLLEHEKDVVECEDYKVFLSNLKSYVKNRGDKESNYFSFVSEEVNNFDEKLKEQDSIHQSLVKQIQDGEQEKLTLSILDKKLSNTFK
jgi:hypothetical protein